MATAEFSEVAGILSATLSQHHLSGFEIAQLEFHQNVYFCFIDYAKAFDCVDYNKLWKILKEMGLSDHLTCLLRNLYAGQEATS